MTNRIIKSLDCRKIILIFCILEVDFTISVITLFVVFNESFQKALVDKSVCVINIVHLIVLPAIKCSDIFACYGGINISDISLLGFHSYFDFCSPFYKTKKIK